MSRNIFFFKYFLFGVFLTFSCTSKILKYEKVDQLKKNSEFESIVKIDPVGETPTASIQAPSGTPTGTPSATPAGGVPPSAQPSTSPPSKSSIAKGAGKSRSSRSGPTKIGGTKSVRSKGARQTTSPGSEPPSSDSTKHLPPVEVGSDASSPAKHLPEIEDGAGFNGRRPLKDPFRVGETVVHEVTYFKVKAGEFEMKVAAPKMVNGRKSYNFIMSLRSSSMFSSFYSVDDSTETLVDFEELIPRVFSLHVKESGQLREGQSYFDHSSLRATHWEKKYTEKNGNEEKKDEWDILPYSQNVFSAIYYLRTFQWEVGKEYVFRIAHDKDNILFRGKAMRKEKISTPLGELNAIVMKPEVSVKGIFKPMGDIFFWLSDDDRKYILRMELNIKIGTLVSEVVRIVPGQN